MNKVKNWNDFQRIVEGVTSGFETIPPGKDIASLTSGVVKFGIDPTSTQMHLGHLIPIRMVKKLKEQGCDVHIILGTFTAQMGDPTGKDTMRPILSSDDTSTNADSILALIKRVLGEDITIHRNGDWFGEYTLPKMMGILSKFNLGQLTSREAFQKRIKADEPVGMHELIVPILQGLDSVEIDADIEVGGSDQMFNFHMTRRTQQMMGQTPETCIMAPIINGTDGRKMSKSYGNCIFLTDSPADVFGKVMSISDETMAEWYPIFKEDYDQSEHPMKLKKALAEIVTEEIWPGKGGEGRAAFEATVQGSDLPDDIPEFEVNDEWDFLNYIAKVSGQSRSQARRLIIQNAVSVNDEKVGLDGEVKAGDIVKVGKRRYGKIV